MFSALFHGKLSLPMKMVFSSFSALTAYYKALALAALKLKMFSDWLCLGSAAAPVSHQSHTSTGSLHCRAGTPLESLCETRQRAPSCLRTELSLYFFSFFPGLIEIKNIKITKPTPLQKPSSLFQQNTPFAIISISLLCALRKNNSFSENHVFA